MSTETDTDADVAAGERDATTGDASEALLQFLYRAPIGLIQIAMDGAVELMNPLAVQLLMPIAANTALDNLFEVLQPFVPGLRAQVDGCPEPAGVICEDFRFTARVPATGTSRIYAISLLKLDCARVMVVLDDTTRKVEREEAAVTERLRLAERVDALTRMPNRTAIAESITAALAIEPPRHGLPAVMILGCRRLEEIAESFGEEARDQVLDLLAQRLRAALRSGDWIERADGTDRIAARVGADEFAALLENLADRAMLPAIAQRLIDALTQPYAVGAHLLHCPVSIGIAAVDLAGRDGESVMHDARIAMREARRLGGSRWMSFDPAMRERAEQRGNLELELRRAIEGDELFVVYQPIVALQTEALEVPLVGVEALIRWRHPTRGLVPPIDFIGLAEDTGLIGALGRHVLRHACRDFARWRTSLADTAPLYVAVNLSRAQLAEPELIEFVRETLAANDMRGSQLQLEVTESLAAQDDTVRTQLHGLKALGITIALDDFGTGYSSLSSLHLMPVDTVKVDRSFVMLAESSPHHRVLIEATIRVAKSLHMTTVAEGIETAGQQTVVQTLGCDKGQGYLYSRPLPADEVATWIAARAGRAMAVATERG